MMPPRLASVLILGLAWSVALGIGLGLAALARADDVPSLVGTWTWSWKDANGDTHKHVLEVEGKGAQLSARERFDQGASVKVNDLKAAGKQVSFSVLRGDRRASYSGMITDRDTINGKVTITAEGGQPTEYGWTAKRADDKP